MNRSHALIYLLFLMFAGVLIARAGILEPPGPPAPTMKTLNALPTSWNELIMLPSRFDVVLNGEGVLDHETGLVWQKSPLNNPVQSDWVWAVHACYNLVVQNRKGWRLPTVEELATLVDVSLAGAGPVLPFGHPFVDVESSSQSWYWSITTSPLDLLTALSVSFSDGEIGGISKTSWNKKYAWCVRGSTGHNPDPIF